MECAELWQLGFNLRAMQVPHFDDIDWLSARPVAAIQNAESLLDRLGATGSMAQRLARYPLPPRLSRILAEAVERGVGEAGWVAAALGGVGGCREKRRLVGGPGAQQGDRAPQNGGEPPKNAR